MSVTGEFHRHLEALIDGLGLQADDRAASLAGRLEAIADDEGPDLSERARRTRSELAPAHVWITGLGGELVEEAESLDAIARIILGE